MLKILKKLNKVEWLFVAISVGLIVASVWLDLKQPTYMSDITKLLTTGG